MFKISQKNSLHLILRLWKTYVRTYRSKVLLAFLFMGIYSAATAAIAGQLKPVVDDIFKNEDINQLKWISIAVLTTFIIKGFADYGQGITLNYVGQSTIARLQKDLFSKMIRLDLPFFMSHKTGKLVSYSTYHMTMVHKLIQETINISKDFFTIIGLVGLMFYHDPILATITLLVLPFVITPLSKSSKKMRKLSGNTQTETGEWVSYITQAFQGIRIIKSYNMESFESKKAKVYTEALKNFFLKSGHIKSRISPIMETLGGVAVVIVIGYGGWQVIMGHNTAGAFFTFIAALLMTHQPMKRLARLQTNLQEGLAALEEIFDVLDQKPHVTNASTPLFPKKIAGALSFEKVTFSYEKEAVIKDLSLDLNAQKTIALVGPSGAGKSTLFNLILRFMDPQDGTISLDGNPLKKIDLSTLRQSISLVSQDVVLFHGTIRENILYGRPDASEDDIKQAAKNAAALEFIEKLPEGFDTLVGEKGLKLSGGQRQRVSLARAFLKDSPILLLDEATSALDSESEKLIQDSLKKLSKGKTTLVIAHRLSTVIQADEILVMDQGKIIERGTHKTLIQKKGLYKKLCDLQLNHD